MLHTHSNARTISEFRRRHLDAPDFPPPGGQIDDTAGWVKVATPKVPGSAAMLLERRHDPRSALRAQCTELLRQRMMAGKSLRKTPGRRGSTGR